MKDHGRTSPAIALSVEMESIVDNHKGVTPWWTTWWPNLGEWFQPGYPQPSTSTSPPAFSRSWSEPTRNDSTGYWQSTAVVCSWIHRSLFSENPEFFHEPKINLRVLRSRFALRLEHRVAGVHVKIDLSQAPWTSGVYRPGATTPGVQNSDGPPESEGHVLHHTTEPQSHVALPPVYQPPPPYLSTSQSCLGPA